MLVKSKYEKYHTLSRELAHSLLTMFIVYLESKGKMQPLIEHSDNKGLHSYIRIDEGSELNITNDEDFRQLLQNEGNVVRYTVTQGSAELYFYFEKVNEDILLKSGYSNNAGTDVLRILYPNKIK